MIRGVNFLTQVANGIKLNGCLGTLLFRNINNMCVGHVW